LPVKNLYSIVYPFLFFLRIIQYPFSFGSIMVYSSKPQKPNNFDSNNA